LYFEIDKYDLYYVPKEIAKAEQLIWKANLLGGGHLFYLIKRMKSQDLRTLGEYLQYKKKYHGWFYGGGYEGLQEATEKPKKAPYLTNKEIIPSNKFVSDELNEYDMDIEHAKLFHRIKEKDQLIFKAPHILIKTHIDLPLLLLHDKDLIFNKDVIGIHVPNKPELTQLGTNIRRNRLLYKALIMLRSGRIGIGRETSILNKDVLDLPYPEDKDKLKLSKAEQIVCDDILNYGIEQLSQGEEAKANTQQAKKVLLLHSLKFSVLH
ncbi:hypothetical protein KA005_10395, partial [bacterium]|nr:hypothetical protein [bacterium]